MKNNEIRDGYEIFKQVFASSMTWEHFCYKHLKNPYRDENISTLVDYEGNKARGTNSFMGCIVRVEKEDYKALQSCDTAVAEQYRGKHIFSNLILRAIEYCKEGEQDFIFGFPNQNSHQGFLKLGFSEVGKFENYYGILRPIHLLVRKGMHCNVKLCDFEDCMRWKYKGLDYEMSIKCPLSDLDVEIINQRKRVFIKRSKEYFRWKLEYMPPNKIAYVCIREKGILKAFFALIKRNNSVCEIADWYINCKDKYIIKGLNHVLKKYCDMVSVMMVNPETEESEWFQGLPFFKRNSKNPFLLYITDANFAQEQITKLKEIRNWELRLIDTDYILNGYNSVEK